MPEYLSDRQVESASKKCFVREKEDRADQKARGRSDHRNLELRRRLRRLPVERRKPSEHVESDVTGSQPFGSRHRRVSKLMRKHRYEEEHRRQDTKRPILQDRQPGSLTRQ